MELQTRHPLSSYLSSDDLIQSDHEAVADEARRLRGDSAVATARVTRSASDVLSYREGICYAKSHLAAALLRASNIPSGICYQRLTLLDDDSAGYVIHALNTVWLDSLGRWIRFDARGNKPGIQAEFSVDEERLAFPIRAQYDEIDYLINYAIPHPVIADTLARHHDAIEMYRDNLPSALEDA